MALSVNCKCGFNGDDESPHYETCTEKGMLNHVACPPASLLTDENEPSEIYFDYDNSRWRRNWCFLGEIVGVVGMIRPGFTLKTRFGETFNIHFYLDAGEKPSTFSWSDCVPGHTMAVLYAERKQFMDMSEGIRQESVDTVFVFKAKLDAVMNHSSRLGCGNNACFACGKISDELKSCGKCHMAKYCSRECQAEHWKRAGNGQHGLLCADMPVLSKLNAGLGKSRYDAMSFKSQ